MSYQVDLLAQEDHLRVSVSGERTSGKDVENALDVWQQAAEKCRKTGLLRVLVVANVPGRLSPDAANRLASTLGGHGLNKDYKVALAFLNPEAFLGHRLTEIIAVSRGHWIKVFDNEDEAKEWLLND